MTMRLIIIDPAPSSRDWIVQGLKKCGHNLVGVTPVRESTGLALCHEQLVADFWPVEALAEKLRTLGPFDGLVCYHQASTGIANRIAHILELPPIWNDPSLDFSNKITLQKHWESAGLEVPQSHNCYKSICDWPVVIKPAGLQGQIGVKLCRNHQQAQEWIRFLSNITVPFQLGDSHYEMTRIYHTDRSPLIQEFIQPDAGTPFESTAEFLVTEGDITYLGGFDKSAVKDDDYFNEEVFVFPEVFPRTPKTIEHLKAYVRATDFQNGFCHLEYKLRNGNPVPIELNVRLVGSPCAQTLSSALGLDLPLLLARASAGRKVTGLDLKPKRHLGYMLVFLPRTYENRQVRGFDFERIKGVEYSSEFFLEDGEEATVWDSCVGNWIGIISFEVSDASKARQVFETISSSVIYEFG